MQNDFFQKKVKPIIKRQKLVVIISDALRYECGSELADEINQISKFNAKIEPMISMIPSYTQLGMASLLPHQKLSFDGTSDRIIADGIPTSGTENREKILKTYTKRPAKTMLAREFTHLKTTERRELIRDHEIIYLYSNKIDQAGDDKMTENEILKAVKAEKEQ